MSNDTIKQIIPNFFIGSNIDMLDDNLSTYNIKNIITINNIQDNEAFNILNLNINSSDLLIKSNKIINVDFNLTNNFIENSYINKENILITSNNIILSAIFAIAFISKKLNTSLYDSIKYVYNKIGIDINQVPGHYINTLFSYIK
jgi:hypothetical protein